MNELDEKWKLIGRWNESSNLYYGIINHIKPIKYFQLTAMADKEVEDIQTSSNKCVEFYIFRPSVIFETHPAFFFLSNSDDN